MTTAEEERVKANAQKIEALKLENARLKKRISERERKVDARRKIVAGSVVLKHADIDKGFHVELMTLLDRFVLDRDRHLFDLAPKPPAGSGPQEAKAGKGKAQQPESRPS